MEIVFQRFSHLSTRIFDGLDNASLLKCVQVSKIWCVYIRAEKFYHIRKIQGTLQEFHPLWKKLGIWNLVFRIWKKILNKANTDTIISLSRSVQKFYIRKPGLTYHQGLTPSHVAAATGNLIVFERIFQNDSNKCSPKDSKGWMPIHYAAQNGHLHLCQFILKNINTENLRNYVGDTPLHAAARNGHLKVCALILGNLKEQNPRNKAGVTPLHLASLNGHLAVCKLLIKDLEEKNPIDIQGMTPLHSAASNGHLNVYQLLMKKVREDSKNTL